MNISYLSVLLELSADFKDTFNELEHPVWWSLEKEGDNWETIWRRRVPALGGAKVETLDLLRRFKADEFPDLAAVWRMNWREAYAFAQAVQTRNKAK